MLPKNPWIETLFLYLHIDTILMEFTANQIAEILNGTVDGDGAVAVSRLSKIEEGTQGSLTFLANPKYSQYIYDTKASIVIISKEFEAEAEIAATLVRVDDTIC